MKRVALGMFFGLVATGSLIFVRFAQAIDPETPTGSQQSPLGSTYVPGESVGELTAPEGGVGGAPLNFAQACPQCAEVERQLQEANAMLQQARQTLSQNRRDQQMTNAKIAELEARLAKGVGATFTVTEPDGKSTTGEILNDESVRYTVRDPQGNVIDTRVEARRGFKDVETELDAERSNWERLKEDEFEAQRRMAEAAQRTKTLRTELADCIEAKCKKFLVMQALVLQAFGISGIFPYSSQNPIGAPVAPPTATPPSSTPPPPSIPPPPPPAVTQCNDGMDNDGDGLVDSADPGCGNAADNNEFDNKVFPGTYNVAGDCTPFNIIPTANISVPSIDIPTIGVSPPLLGSISTCSINPQGNTGMCGTGCFFTFNKFGAVCAITFLCPTPIGCSVSGSVSC